MEARRLLISGRVQGVGFRYGMVLAAQRLAISGWVRNRRAGQVEALIVGDSAAIAAMLAWAHCGPPGASIEHVAVEFAETSELPGHAGFEQWPDA